MGATGGWVEYDVGKGELLASGPVRRQWRSFRRSGGFRTVELNLVGWAAVILPGLAAGTLTAMALRRPPWSGALTGAVTSWLVAVTIDNLRYRRSEIRFVLDVATGVEARRIVDDLRADGIDVSVAEEPDLSEGAKDATIWVLHGTMGRRRAIERRIWPS